MANPGASVVQGLAQPGPFPGPCDRRPTGLRHADPFRHRWASRASRASRAINAGGCEVNPWNWTLFGGRNGTPRAPHGWLGWQRLCHRDRVQTACAEDRATLESDPSAGTGTVHGAGPYALPCCRPPDLHRLESDKLIRCLPAPLAFAGVALATAPRTRWASGNPGPSGCAWFRTRLR